MDQFNFPDYDWNARTPLGKGGFGAVFKVKNKKTGEYVAIKQMDMANFDKDYKVEALKTEIQAMKELDSPYTVGIVKAEMGKKYTYIILQLCESDLKKVLEGHGYSIPEKQCAKIYSDLAKGFKLLNEHGYIHRDVKPDNVLIKDKVHRIADFGFAKKLDKFHESKIKECCGTPLYMAPQLLFKEQYNAKCDIWSLGLMLYELLFGYAPWPFRHPTTYKKGILSIPVAFPYQAKIGTNTRDFIIKSLVVNEGDRMNWPTFFNHPFIKGDVGAPHKFFEVNKNYIPILARIQESIHRKNTNLLMLFSKQANNKKAMNREEFFTFIKKFDSMITTFQSEKLFEVSDINKDGKIDVKQFFNVFCSVDYRPPGDIASRMIQQVIAIAQQRNVNIQNLFKLFDKDKSGQISKKQFQELIWKIVPQFTEKEVKLIWKKLDKDGSGEIDAKEFYEQMTRNTMNNYKDERAKRNLSCLREYLKHKKITPQVMLEKADKDKNKCLTLDQFGPTVQAINYVITKDEIIQMFNYLDYNKSKTIEIDEIKSFLEGKE